MTVGGGEHRDRLAKDLLGAIAVDLLRAAVPADDRAVKRPRDDRVLRGLDDRRQLSLRLLGVALFGDVLPCAEDPQGPPVVAQDDVAACTEHAHGAVRANNPVVKAKRLPGRAGRFDGCREEGTVLRMHVFEDALQRCGMSGRVDAVDATQLL